MIVFDLDGVLIDSRQAVTTAYARAGVVMPSDAWGQPASEWLDDERAHRKKTRAYCMMILRGEVPTLDGVDIVRLLRAAHLPIGFATGASQGALVCALIRTRIRTPWMYAAGCSSLDKIRFLRDVNARVYVDDNADIGADVADAAGCHFIHYRPGKKHVTYERIMRAWTQSS